MFGSQVQLSDLSLPKQSGSCLISIEDNKGEDFAETTSQCLKRLMRSLSKRIPKVRLGG